MYYSIQAREAELSMVIIENYIYSILRLNHRTPEITC